MKRILLGLMVIGLTGLTGCGAPNGGFYKSVKDCNQNFSFGNAEYSVTTPYSGASIDYCTYGVYSSQGSGSCTIDTPNGRLVFNGTTVVSTLNGASGTFNFLPANCSTSAF